MDSVILCHTRVELFTGVVFYLLLDAVFIVESNNASR